MDDETRDALQRQADEAGVTVSDFIRALIREAVMDLGNRVTRDGYTPETLSPKDRHILSLLHRILGRVLPKDTETDSDGDEEYQLERARVLEEGFTLEYETEYAGISAELSARDSLRVMDIFELFRMTGDSIKILRQQGITVPEDLEEDLSFRGFDFNDQLESKMAAYARFMINDDRWEEQADFIKGRTGGNSHKKMLDTYMRMLSEYRRVRSRRRPTFGRDYPLTLEELEAIAAERVHPDNR
uniref:YfbU family protein n=1 Tax=Curtobacterium poinsettiae TaxID=159612 RepID=UPI002B407959|nr:YfbU family protein [Curtobacterium flaccumfaciens]